MMLELARYIGLFVLVFCWPLRASAETWQIPAQVTDVTDGDTVKILARPYPDLYQADRVRLLGLDTPEIYHPHCRQEAKAGETARRRAVQLLESQNVVVVSDGKRDGFGRLLARLRLSDGRDYASVMIEERLGRTRKPQSWCALLGGS